MVIDILTLFPSMFESVFGESIIKRSREKGHLTVRLHDLRRWTTDAHRTADDKPFGGGPGMVMKVEPIYRALEELDALAVRGAGARSQGPGRRTILLTPQGRVFRQTVARELAAYERLVMICGHYEGVDERVRSLVDDEISIGDYILTCGEIPAMAVVDAVTRLIPGVLGHEDSASDESFEQDLLEYPQFTRPAVYRGMAVPEVLLSGDHAEIAAWRRRKARERTAERRPDLLPPASCGDAR